MTEYSLAWRGGQGGHGRTDIILPTNGWVWIIYHVLIPGSTQRVGLAALLYLLLIEKSDHPALEEFVWLKVSFLLNGNCELWVTAWMYGNNYQQFQFDAHQIRPHGGLDKNVADLVTACQAPMCWGGEGGRGVIMPCKGSIIMRTSYNDRDMS